mmetsp:Transcript_38798/g.81254  ORF Transcript_38798/g.81254 Transcript_38798/m.81254 type:complete len:247 (-) Transcript_38798:80-820(-)
MNRVPSIAIRKPFFGIVAALTKNRVIGVNGKLPWKPNSIPQDKEHFVNLTKNNVLILGRKSFAEEDPTGAHVNHVRVCIVVSRTMSASDLTDRNNNRSGSIIGNNGDNDGDCSRSSPEVKLARSFDEALDMASKELIPPAKNTTGNDDDDRGRCKNFTKNNDDAIQCWVGGGERIYKEALGHDNASVVQLTHVDMTVDLDKQRESSTKRSATSSFAFFPLEYLERSGFQEVSKVNSGMCTFSTYKR